ncbi:putative glycoside hydrolase family 55 protein [Eutypa lata UCREL1]|uniref:Putative glycoside hydrolase family 55 protein n=1 Tax=Eutypa lata (strain UCR-EL1) TaxID=1287681 RepID=M7SGL2_EUTLA|nr:putative glycoside hydrolase family 55 protein [Eutypa lata UCREL1]
MKLLFFVLSFFGLASAYWLEDIKHQGLAPFGGDGYTVFRNVKDFGATGDGTTDDTQAILDAMNDPGNRCMQGCASKTETPAVVYFPAGTYLISSSIVTPYYTQMIGDPTDRPVLKATANFAGFGLIDGNPYYTEDPNWVTVNVFFRQVRNFVIDTTNIAPGTAATGMHWPSSQATSLINIEFNMPEGDNSVHVGLFIESGSGGFMSDLTFNGGATGASMGNQQYTMKNFTFNNCKTAIIQIWNWGWTYIGLSINNCGTGIDLSAGYDGEALNVGSVTILDSTISNTDQGIITARTASSVPDAAGGLILENVVLDNVPIAVASTGGDTVLAGGSTTIAGWGQGHRYTPTGPEVFQADITPNVRAQALLADGDRYYVPSKPQYEDVAATDILSARDAGAVGDGVTDDTKAIQDLINQGASSGKVVFLDYGLYVVTDTILVPAGSRIVGESYAVIMGSGTAFQDMTAPKPVFKVGAESGATGRVEFSEFIVSTKGPAPGAILVEYNLNSAAEASGFWDFHTRVGGYSGSEFQIAQCAKKVGDATIDPNCISAYMAIHATKQSGGLYLENTWIWTADHDIEDATNSQITIFSGRGILIESETGGFWLVGGASEHFHLYQYQFANTKNIFAAMLQTETPYYQPLPDATQPFTVNADLQDPDFSTSCNGVEGNCANAWGLRIIDSSDIFIYGAGHYSFFNNYDTSCNEFANGSNCQARIISIEGDVSNVNIYDLSTIGTLSMIDRDGTSLATWEDNKNTYAANIIMYRTG